MVLHSTFGMWKSGSIPTPSANVGLFSILYPTFKKTNKTEYDYAIRKLQITVSSLQGTKGEQRP